MSPVKSTRLLYDKLIKQKVPAILHIFPQTDHAFNRFLPHIAPAAHSALYDTERFMALIAKQATNRDWMEPRKEKISVQKKNISGSE